MIAQEIETSRLRLQPFTEADIPQLILLLGARDVAKMTLRIPHPYTEQDAKAFVAKAPSDKEIQLAVKIRSDRQLCGGVGLSIEPDHQRAELGYWIGVPYWGNGYATETARAMLHYGFEVLRLHRVAATCMTHNPVSSKILLKLGMRHEGCLREHQKKWGELLDVNCYGILRREWDSNSGSH